mmetsp:Transcript_104850/g.296578  ORF Transcript_104850/g.296578 Transcript_104850/m.296578 type:complete len:483 (+) Transcript_104850:97-1545(+)
MGNTNCSKPGRENWVKDECVTNCGMCLAEFGLATRRHHCRACGNIFCAQCCGEKTPYTPGSRRGEANYTEKPKRVCKACLHVLTRKVEGPESPRAPHGAATPDVPYGASPVGATAAAPEGDYVFLPSVGTWHTRLGAKKPDGTALRPDPRYSTAPGATTMEPPAPAAAAAPGGGFAFLPSVGTWHTWLNEPGAGADGGEGSERRLSDADVARSDRSDSITTGVIADVARSDRSDSIATAVIEPMIHNMVVDICINEGGEVPPIDTPCKHSARSVSTAAESAAPAGADEAGDKASSDGDLPGDSAATPSTCRDGAAAGDVAPSSDKVADEGSCDGEVEHRVGDIVILGIGATSRFQLQPAVVVEVGERNCAVTVLDDSRRYVVGACRPALADIRPESQLLRQGSRVVIKGMQGNAKNQRLNGLTGEIVSNARMGHPLFVRTKAGNKQQNQLMTYVSLDRPPPGSEKSVLLEPRFLARRDEELA